MLFLRVAAGITLAFGLFQAGCQQVPRPAGPGHPTLDRTVMVGYQGWFRTPDDGAGMGWAHYQKSTARPFSLENVGIDFWPDLSELTAAEKTPTGLRAPDGSPLQLFSSHNARTVARHFEWMRDYGISGAFIQRFASPIIHRDSGSLTRLRATDTVLGFARAGAERAGRSLAVMYDLSGLQRGEMTAVMDDWKHLVDDLRIRESSAYQFHQGHPVVAVWGIGFNDGRRYTLEECEQLVDFLKHDPKYGGNTVMLGIPTGWREQTGDATDDPRLPALLKQADILSPWTPGRYRDLAGIRTHYERYWEPDHGWCEANHVGYMPVVFPGFSWRNLKNVQGGIDRLDGRFLWEQYRQLINGGFTMIYQAMFDEMDEGTQIFKVTATPPPGAFFQTYAPRPSDYYLQLVRRTADYLAKAQPVPETITP